MFTRAIAQGLWYSFPCEHTCDKKKPSILENCYDIICAVDFPDNWIGETTIVMMHI